MHKPRRHRRQITSNSSSKSQTSTSTSTSTSRNSLAPTSSITTKSPSDTTLTTSTTSSSTASNPIAQVFSGSVPNASSSFVAPSPSSSITPDAFSSSPSVTPQDSSTARTTVAFSTTVATSTIYLSTGTTIVNSKLPDVSASPTPSVSPTTSPLTLGSRDGIIILSLSIFAGILCIFCAFIIWRHCRRDSHESLEYQVDPISFYQSDTAVSRRRTHGNNDSLTHLANFSPLETSSPQDIKSMLRERDSPNHRLSHESESIPSPPITPTRHYSRCSPAPDILDSRWPGRLLPLMHSNRGSALTLDSSQVVVISGDMSHQSYQSDAGSGTQPEGTATASSNLQVASGPDNGQQTLGGISPVTADVPRIPPTKGELENSARQREAGQTGGGMWDGPPPEESEKAESAKTGPPAYTPGCDMQGVSVPLPLPPGGALPLPVLGSSSGTARMSNSVRRLPLQ